jgi:hypothetical protein
VGHDVTLPLHVTSVSRDSVFSITLRRIFELATAETPLKITNDVSHFTFSIGNASWIAYELDEIAMIELYAGLRGQIEVEKYKEQQKLQSSSFILPGPSGELKLGR